MGSKFDTDGENHTLRRPEGAHLRCLDFAKTRFAGPAAWLSLRNIVLAVSRRDTVPSCAGSPTDNQITRMSATPPRVNCNQDYVRTLKR
jgi:hypothetical protein